MNAKTAKKLRKLAKLIAIYPAGGRARKGYSVVHQRGSVDDIYLQLKQQWVAGTIQKRLKTNGLTLDHYILVEERAAAKRKLEAVAEARAEVARREKEAQLEGAR